jgi:UDPglucose--hexose-1-phosphate uridylyltransferase
LLNEIRKDYLLSRWVVIATHRKRRPTDFMKKEATAQHVNLATCPFCPGNERMTPPAVLVYLKDGQKVARKKDADGKRYSGWQIRCVPNMFSAFSPPDGDETFESGKATGHHEVLIESPHHTEHPATARLSQLASVVNGYVDRLTALTSKPYVRYVSIFRNHGVDAGASLSHAHSQVIAMPMIPPIIREELQASRDFYEIHRKCLFCDILKRERAGSRFVWENQDFAAFTAWAGVNPFEFWIMPKKHQGTLVGMTPQTIEKLAEALKTCMGKLQSLLADPPYNYGFHVAPDMKAGEYYHWHLEVYPKLSIWAGFEKSTGTYINTVPPEDAAQGLRDAIATQ